MLRHILPIARYTLLEALRNRLLWLALILVAAGLAFTQFLQQVAITESNQIQAALLAAVLRIGAVFMLAGFVVTSMVREFNDKVMELILSRPLRRSSYFFGKLAGYAAVALALALIASLPLALFAPPARVALWGLSLACELLIVTAFALFCVFSLTQVMSALAAVAGFYLLSRSISALQIMAANPLIGSQPGPKGRRLRHRRDRLPAARPGPHDPDRLADLWRADGGRDHARSGADRRVCAAVVRRRPVRPAAQEFLMRCDERPLSHVSAPVLALLAAGLALQLGLHAALPEPRAQAPDLMPPPTASLLRLASFGEPIALAKILMLQLQAFDYQSGSKVPYKDLDYAHRRGLALAHPRTRSRGTIPAARSQPPVRRGSGRSAAAQHARFRLPPVPARPQPALALARARHLPRQAPPEGHGPGAQIRGRPAKVHHGQGRAGLGDTMEIFIREDLNELETERIMIGGLIASGRITDPSELKFLDGRLHEIEERLKKEREEQRNPKVNCQNTDISV